MKALIEVEMGKKTCGPCIIRERGESHCLKFDTILVWRDCAYLRCPACLAKYARGATRSPKQWAK